MFPKAYPVRCLIAASLLLATGCGSGVSTAAAPPATSPQLTLSATSLTFTGTTVGQTSASQVLTLANSGNATLTLSGITLSDSVNYSMMSTCGASLATSATCTLTIEFKPQSAVSLPATITVQDNATGSPQTVALSGTGTTAATPQATLTPSAGLPFASTLAGSTASAQTLTLANGGNAALSIAGIAIGGANPSVFAETTTCAATLPAGTSCTISVTFTPAAASTNYSASLTVTDNSGNVAGSTQSAPLTGSGAAPVATPQAVLSTSSITFTPATNVGTSAGAQTVMLSNPGGAALTSIVISIGGGTASSAFTETNTCGSTLAAGGNCSIAVNFTPSTTGNFIATLSVTDNATGSPQTVALAGTGAAPQVTLTSTSISFATTTVGTTTSSSSVTLTNSGNATLNISSILLGGANPSDFAETTTCGATLAALANCTISATFTPAAANAYSASITVADNAAAGSPQTISLGGSGTTASVSYTFYAFPETDLSVTPLYTLINSAQKTIDMTMYALEDTKFSGDLVAACNRNVKVRVILDQNDEKSGNTPAYNQLNAVTNCSAVWANKAFEATHEKSFILDGTQVAIMSLNLQTQYYSTTRDFALLENDPVDIAAIQATFNADYAAGTPNSGVAGASDFSYVPTAGNDLIWSPTTAQVDMLAIINNATSTLLVENEEMGAANIVSALEAACQRKVVVHIAMVDDSTKAPYSSYSTEFTALEAAGCFVHTYADTTTGLYIHAKAVVADYGLGTQNVYMGSINYSNASMTQNRELGVYITDPASVQALYTTMTSDYAGAPAF
jgi:PLD-like domain/Abnormal spindle-like microcephaly-assoc'd, ASPM-SPD-2-Hydin